MSLRILLSLVLVISTSLVSTSLSAATDSYQYDPLGRLTQWTDAQGRVTQYRYDAVGNILEVKRVNATPAPTITTVTPANIRRGESKLVTVTGTNLLGITLTSPSAELSVSGVQITATQLSFNLNASANAPLGAASFSVMSGAGSAIFGVTVSPSAPTIIINPAPLAVPVDNTDRTFFIRLSASDNIDHVLTLASANAAIALVTPAMLTITAGQTETTAKVRGVSDGTTSLTISSPGITSSSVGIYVTSEFGGINVATAPLLGVVLGSNNTGGGTMFATDFVSPVVGVAFGRYITSINPANFIVGTGPTPITINGAGLEAVTGILVNPPDGVTISAVTPAGNGNSVTANITVAANAPTTQRQVTLTGGAGSYAPTRPEADRINITFPVPVVDSIEPFFAEPGASMQFVIRGKNLSGATGVSFSPATGVSVGAPPVVSPDGTQLTVGVSLALNAPTGDRIVTVQAAIGSSDATPSPANTFHIVTLVQSNFTPIVAPLVGVVVGAASNGTTSNFEITSSALGVSLGAVATNLSPNAAQFGTSLTLTVQGAGLQGATAVSFVPPDGITVGTIVPAADGSGIAVPITLAANAAQTVRQVQVLAGTTAVAFAPAANNQFRVAGPAPRIDSITPQLISVGTTVPITITGINFQNASEIRVTPSTGISVGTISVSSDGSTTTVPFAIAANAPVGQRSIVVVTPAGETDAMATVNNTITIYSGNAASYDPIVAPLLGVVVGSSSGPTTTTIDPVVAPLLGVVVTPNPPAPTSADYEITSSALSVALGAAATGIQATPFNLGTAATITINGVALNGVTAVSASPATDLVLGSPNVSGDGLTITIPVTIGATAALGIRTIRLTAGATTVAFAKPENATITITSGVPRIDSIEPILGARNSTLSFIIRGGNLQFTNAISITPADGVSFEANPLIDAAGTTITLRMRIDSAATVGARRVEVTTPGGTSSAITAPANTFTVN